MTDQDRQEELAQLRRLEVLSAVEATTLLLLIGIAVPLKHLSDWPFGVQVMGPMHGVAFSRVCVAGRNAVSGRFVEASGVTPW